MSPYYCCQAHGSQRRPLPVLLYLNLSSSVPNDWKADLQEDSNRGNVDYRFWQNSPLPKLLRTCKQAYIEALPFLYREIDFEIYDTEHLNLLVDHIGPNAAAYVKSLTQLDHEIYEERAKLTCAKSTTSFYALRSLRKLTIYMRRDHYAFDKTGDDMHPICVLRGIVLEVIPHEVITANEDSNDEDGAWYKAHKTQCKVFEAKMIAHVAQPRGDEADGWAKAKPLPCW